MAQVFSDHANLSKSGVARLDQMGAYAVIANKVLVEKGIAGKWAVVNVSEEWVDSVHLSHGDALTQAKKLIAQ